MFHRQQLGWIGIDVGTYTIKVAQLARSIDKLHVVSQAIVPRSTSTDSCASEAENQWIASGDLAAAVSLSPELRGKRAAATMPMALCDMHSVDYQLEETDDLETIVRRAVESVTQSSASHLQFDIWPAEKKSSSDSPVRWNILAVARASSDQLYWDIVENNFACQRIDSLPHSLARAIGLGNTIPSDIPLAILDWGYSQATFCIVLEGRPVYARVLKDCGLHRLIDSLASDLQIQQEEAFELLQVQGLRGLISTREDDIAAVVAELSSEAVEQLKIEIFRTLSYLDGSRRSIKPKRLYLFGGGGLIQQVAPYLTKQLKLETHVWELNPLMENADSQKSNQQCIFGPAFALSALAWEEA